MEIIATESTVLLIDSNTSETKKTSNRCFKRKTYGIIRNVAHFLILSTQLMIGMLITMQNEDYVECSDVMFVCMVTGFYIKLILIMLALDLNNHKRIVAACTLTYLMFVTSLIVLMKSTSCYLQEKSTNIQYADFAVTLVIATLALVKTCKI